MEAGSALQESAGAEGQREIRALVTGGGSGMGLAIARRLKARDASVLICGRREEVLASAIADLEELDTGSARQLVVDLERPEGAATAVDACVESFGGIEVLVNNAGIAEFCRFEEITVESWDRSQKLMVRAPMLAIQAALPLMAAAGGGRVVNNSSVSGFLSEPGSAQYSAAKAALISLTRTAAVDLAARGIRVNAVAPGWVKTDLSSQFLDSVDLGRFDRVNPAARVGEPDEIAAVVEFLALDAPDFLNGETILVDGAQAPFLPLPE
jgi:NAD(P)-dependent dehydrogenase (short-subunit alcohol dehydrogenase family)